MKQHIYLFESKRDNLLLTYFEAINNICSKRGLNVSFGQFKSKLLSTLSSDGGMHNLSLRSNYYLAGAARYYFNGDLTNNKQVALFDAENWISGNGIRDQWNDEVCKRLDACIVVLRNSYIDSVGVSFEQPEDFGTLSIAKLLRKYNKAINKELGIVEKPKTTKEKPVIDESPTVGNNYTFEIMYSQADCQKYERPTSPGAWCITYGQGHYDSYVRRLKIHYVIFRMDGWENVQRPEDPTQEPGWSRQKPHDLYGNSLIAMLQSNSSPEPVYITSRWNHGYGESRCEADHAYTKEEFQQITGVTDDDLKRIYDIWKMNKPSVSSNNGAANAAKTREMKVHALRSIKYAQMRINSGENPNQILRVIDTLGSNDTRINKILSVCRLANEDNEMHDNSEDRKFMFIVDRGKILFETITQANTTSFNIAKDKVMFVRFYTDWNKSVSYVVNLKTHKLLTVDGKSCFLSTPRFMPDKDDINYRYFCVNRSAHDFVLIDSETLTPVRLPNGEYWVNNIERNYYDWRAGRGKDGGRWFNEDDLLTITYDSASGEKYLFDIEQNHFLQNLVSEEDGVADVFDFHIKNIYKDYFVIVVNNEGREEKIFNRKTGQALTFGYEKSLFHYTTYIGYDLCLVQLKYGDNKYILADCRINKNLESIDNRYETHARAAWGYNENDEYLKLEILSFEERASLYRIINKSNRKFIINPFKTESDPTVFRSVNVSDSWVFNNHITDGDSILDLYKGDNTYIRNIQTKEIEEMSTNRTNTYKDYETITLSEQVLNNLVLESIKRILNNRK